MINETHYLDVRIGIDFSTILSPENVQGVKFMLGVQSDEEVVQNFSQEIVKEVATAIQKRQNYAYLNGAEIQLVIRNNEELIGSDESDGLEPVLDMDTVSDLDYVDEIYNDSPEEEADLLIYDDYSKELIEAIGKDLFVTRANIGEDIKVYLKHYNEYGATIANEVDVDVLDASELEENLESNQDISNLDYIVSYKDFVTKKVVFGGKNLKKYKEKGE